MTALRLLLIGDIVGKPGRRALAKALPGIVASRGVDFVIANGENAARGSGITEKLYGEIVRAGVDVVTLGDHVWKRKDVVPMLTRHPNLLRPANLPAACPGAGWVVASTAAGARIGIVTVLGRIFMGPAECPFRTAVEAVARMHQETAVVVVEIHAEATSEKVAMGWKLAGEASCVFGTHTHVQTADERVLRGGTAYITDLGMTGPHESIIGRDIDSVLFKFETQMHATFTVARGDVRISGALVDIDADSGRATRIERLVLPVAMDEDDVE